MKNHIENKKRLLSQLEINPVIAAVKNENGLADSLNTDCEIVFVLYGSVCDISSIVESIKKTGKTAIVHADLIQGLSSRVEAIDYIRGNTEADGIMSTKPVLVRHAVENGLVGILRTFIIDSIALENVKKQIESAKPDLIEIMPGIMPEIIEKLKNETKLPLIAGGLIDEKRKVIEALSAGADAVSTTREELWRE